MKKIIIIGGGPAGTTLGNYLLLHSKHEVEIIEKENFPRHHVGESLQPDVFQTLKNIGVDISEFSHFPKKYGAAYKWGMTNEIWTVLYAQELDELYESGKTVENIEQYEHGYNVDRSEFDALLLQAFRDKGGIYTQAKVEKIHLQDDNSIKFVELASGEEKIADIYIDASGQNSLISSMLDLKIYDQLLKNSAIFKYIKGYRELDSVLGKDYQYIENLGDRWFWWIPISYDIVSVGMVSNTSKKYGADEFETSLESSDIWKSIQNAQWVNHKGEQEDRYYYAADWSFISKQAYGKNWFLLGDAYGFVDPILSGGVSFSMEKAQHLGKTIILSLQKPELSEKLGKTYELKYKEDILKYLKMAYVWYSKTNAKQDWIELTGDKRKFVEYISGGKRFLDQSTIFQDWQNEKIYKRILETQ